MYKYTEKARLNELIHSYIHVVDFFIATCEERPNKTVPENSSILCFANTITNSHTNSADMAQKEKISKRHMTAQRGGTQTIRIIEQILLDEGIMENNNINVNVAPCSS